MDINTLLSELVIVANAIDARSLADISADIDAAIFTMSSDSALPRNKSLASVVRENYAAVDCLQDDEIETLAVSAAEEISELTEEVLAQDDPKKIVAVLTSMAQSLRSVLHPNGVLSKDVAKVGSKFLADAEQKLSQDEALHALGYRIGVIRSKIEKNG
jgi:hypothetical protein